MEEKTVAINYEAVGPDGADNFGSVAPESESVKVKTGNASGSAPTAEPGYRFVGWYKDEDCTEPVEADWVTDNKITPRKPKTSGLPPPTMPGLTMPMPTSPLTLADSKVHMRLRAPSIR